MKKLIMALLLFPVLGQAAETSYHLDNAPDRSGDQAALQNGAKLFVNYCLSCHSASFFRYNKLREIGLDDQQIIDNLLFTQKKVGDQMRIAMLPEDGRRWFGKTPPDLTLVARARASGAGSGADWLYTYLRSFYRDSERDSGWNNVVFKNVGMPHVMWSLQGEQRLVDGQLVLDKAGSMSPDEYDAAVADLVAFLVLMGEPDANSREWIGLFVILFLLIILGLAVALKKEFWKDVH